VAEGLFEPSRLAIPGVPADALQAAMVRVLPRTVLVLDFAADAEDAWTRARNETNPDGSETWFRYFAREDVAKVDDPEFAMGMVRFEFSRAVKAGAAFPAIVPLDGGGTGFAIAADGRVLTNYHLVVSEVLHHRREGGVVSRADECRSLKAQVARRGPGEAWTWQDATRVRLVSNPPASRALEPDATGLLHPREDTALLEVEPAPSAWLPLSTRRVEVGEAVWMAGFPLRTARSRHSLDAVGYPDADGTLRVSSGRVVTVGGDRYFTTDLDGAAGNSGSPVFDAAGEVVGMFSRATGAGPRNALEYGKVERVHVASRLAVEGLALAGTLPARPGR
jgi:S1-C subfamily serine protease